MNPLRWRWRSSIRCCRTFTTFACAALLSLVGCGSNPASSANRHAPSGTGFVMQSYKMPDGKMKKCTVFIPFKYDAKRPWPTIVFLQGLGEGGNDGVKNTTVGLGPAIARNPHRFDFIAIFPQSAGGTWSGDDAQKMAIASLDATAKRYNVDPDRVILTGLSTGGYGTWLMGARYPNRWAGLVPMCGYSGKEVADKLTHVPIWAFHNGGDPFVFAGSTKETVKEINRRGGQAKQTIYGAIGHNCWDRAYGDGELLAWMRQQRR